MCKEKELLNEMNRLEKEVAKIVENTRISIIKSIDILNKMEVSDITTKENASSIIINFNKLKNAWFDNNRKSLSDIVRDDENRRLIKYVEVLLIKEDNITESMIYLNMVLKSFQEFSLSNMKITRLLLMFINKVGENNRDYNCELLQHLNKVFNDALNKIDDLSEDIDCKNAKKQVLYNKYNMYKTIIEDAQIESKKCDISKEKIFNDLISLYNERSLKASLKPIAEMVHGNPINCYKQDKVVSQYNASLLMHSYNEYNRTINKINCLEHITDDQKTKFKNEIDKHYTLCKDSISNSQKRKMKIKMTKNEISLLFDSIFISKKCEYILENSNK